MGHCMIRSDYYVYTYSYPNGVPFYVGKGSGGRDRVHLCDAKASRNQDKWAVRVIGKLLASGEQPTIVRLIENIDNELACFIEEEYIDKYGRRDLGTGILVNCTSGGDKGAPALNPEAQAKKVKKFVDWSRNERVVDAEYSKRISEGLKAYYKEHPISEEHKQYLSKALAGENNPFYGKTHTPEAVAKIIAANKGKSISEEAKAKQRVSMAGKHQGADNPFHGKQHSAETMDRMAVTRRHTLDRRKAEGKPHWNTGRRHSEETRAKHCVERTCPHCGRTGKGSAMIRYHMNNCKSKEAGNN